MLWCGVMGLNRMDSREEMARLVLQFLGWLDPRQEGRGRHLHRSGRELRRVGKASQRQWGAEHRARVSAFAWRGQAWRTSA